MIANVNLGCDNCNYDLDFVESLQVQINQRLSAKINRERISKQNDLGICFDKENYWELDVYNRILTQIKYCSSCLENEDFEQITGLVKNAING